MWDKIKSWLAAEWSAIKKSGTMLLAWATSAAGAVIAVLIDLLHDPNISAAIQSALKPEYIPYYIIAAGFIIRVVRKHNATDL